MDREAWWATVYGAAKRVGRDLVTEQQVTESNSQKYRAQKN